MTGFKNPVTEAYSLVLVIIKLVELFKRFNKQNVGVLVLRILCFLKNFFRRISARVNLYLAVGVSGKCIFIFRDKILHLLKQHNRVVVIHLLEPVELCRRRITVKHIEHGALGDHIAPVHRNRFALFVNVVFIRRNARV